MHRIHFSVKRYTPCLFALCLNAGAMGARAAAAPGVYRVTATAPVTVSLPVRASKGPVRVYAGTAHREWTPLPCTLSRDGSAAVRLDDSWVQDGAVLLVVNPPRPSTLRDREPPVVLHCKLGEKSLAGRTAVWNAGSLARMPAQLVLQVRDRSNSLRRESALVTVNGEACPLRYTPGKTAREATLTARLPVLGNGIHRIECRIADAAPRENLLTRIIRLSVRDRSNMALAESGAVLRGDSSFTNYPSLASLQDGVTVMPGVSAGNDLTWASDETDTPHWLEIHLKKPVRLREVSLYWARPSSGYHTSRQFEIQVPAGAGWRAVWHTPAAGLATAACTRCPFAPVVTDRIRVYQTAGGGSAARPNLLWQGEVEVR